MKGQAHNRRQQGATHQSGVSSCSYLLSPRLLPMLKAPGRTEGKATGLLTHQVYHPPTYYHATYPLPRYRRLAEMSGVPTLFRFRGTCMGPGRGLSDAAFLHGLCALAVAGRPLSMLLSSPATP